MIRFQMVFQRLLVSERFVAKRALEHRVDAALVSHVPLEIVFAFRTPIRTAASVRAIHRIAKHHVFQRRRFVRPSCNIKRLRFGYSTVEKQETRKTTARCIVGGEWSWRWNVKMSNAVPSPGDGTHSRNVWIYWTLETRGVSANEDKLSLSLEKKKKKTNP